MADPREQRVLDAARTLVQHWDDQDGFGADIIDALAEAVHALDGAPTNSGEVSWLVKDFNALYRASQNALVDPTTEQWLRHQLERLRPAFEMTETARRAARLGIEVRPATDAEASKALDDYHAQHGERLEREALEAFAARGRGAQQAVDDVLAKHEATKKAGEGD